MFINEIRLNIDYLNQEIQKRIETITVREQARFESYIANVREGIEYYKALIPKLAHETERYKEAMRRQLQEFEEELAGIIVPGLPALATA